MDDARSLPASPPSVSWGAKAIVKKVEVRKALPRLPSPPSPRKRWRKPRRACPQVPVAQTPASSKKWQLIVFIVLVVVAALVMKFIGKRRTDAAWFVSVGRIAELAIPFAWTA